MAYEKRLIDANALLKEIERIYSEHYKNSCYKFIHDFFKAIFRRIRRCPTVDAVEVTKCGFCKHWDEIEETEGGGYCHHPCWMVIGHEPPFVQFADFCSYGEKAETKRENDTKCSDFLI